MSNVEGQVQEHQALSPPRSANGRTPIGYKVLHVIVPERIFNHVKANAFISGLRFPEYVAKLLEETCLYQVERGP